MKAVVAVLMACDTKGEEANYLKEKILSLGADVLLIDVGILGDAKGVVPEITNAQLATIGGVTLSEIRGRSSRGDAVQMVCDALRVCLLKLYADGKIDGACAVGGSGSVGLTAAAMQSLPFGVPKLIASTLASGHREFEPFVGNADMTVLYPVVDICGLNWLSEMMFDNIAGAMVGMCSAGAVKHGKREKQAEKCIGVTMYGQTTPGVMAAKAVLEAAGYTCLIFHGNGVGGPCMEKMIKQKELVGVLDYTVSELVGTHIRGYTRCTKERMTVAGQHGLPQVVLPGACDFINIFESELNLAENAGRSFYKHNIQYPLIRTTPSEMQYLGAVMAEILGQAKGPAALILPSMGFSTANRPGEKLWDKKADDLFRETVRDKLDRETVELIEYEGNINDTACGQLAARTLLRLIGEGSK